MTRPSPHNYLFVYIHQSTKLSTPVTIASRAKSNNQPEPKPANMGTHVQPKTELFKAIGNADEALVQGLLGDAAHIATINTVCDKVVETALGLAVCLNEENLVSLLLDRGADIDVVAG